MLLNAHVKRRQRLPGRAVRYNRAAMQPGDNAHQQSCCRILASSEVKVDDSNYCCGGA